MKLARHFTATGFLVYEDQLALHWHPKVKAWLPPGGHINPNEDPIQAVRREIEEESGVVAEVVPTSKILDLEYPEILVPPFTIMIEDIEDPVDGHHQHIDLIYFCKPIGKPALLKNGWYWIDRPTLKKESPIDRATGLSIPPPEDVLILAEHAFAMVP